MVDDDDDSGDDSGDDDEGEDGVWPCGTRSVQQHQQTVKRGAQQNIKATSHLDVRIELRMVHTGILRAE